MTNEPSKALLGDRKRVMNKANCQVMQWQFRQTEMYAKDRSFAGTVPTKKWQIDKLSDDEVLQYYQTNF